MSYKPATQSFYLWNTGNVCFVNTSTNIANWTFKPKSITIFFSCVCFFFSVKENTHLNNVSVLESFILTIDDNKWSYKIHSSVYQFWIYLRSFEQMFDKMGWEQSLKKLNKAVLILWWHKTGLYIRINRNRHIHVETLRRRMTV